MGTQYLIDTNAVIEFLGNTLPVSGSTWLQSIIDQNLYHLSVINQIELLGFNGSPAEMQTLEDFVMASNVLPLSDVIVQRTIALRRANKIKLPDAIIAATALSYKLKIVTHNVSDFGKIPDLICVDAHAK
ncbi:MAG: type II toxin-antitoxin system VapC family toxin [Lewinellaceae bacterium]|nr:type II toxin-antitoxin system VapC family toxin [Lewinellaceae bacterium]